MEEVEKKAEVVKDQFWSTEVDVKTPDEYRVRSVNSESFTFGSDFVFFSQEKTNSDSNMKLLLFTERTLSLLNDLTHLKWILWPKVGNHFKQNFPEYLDHYASECTKYYGGKQSFPQGNPTVHCQDLMNSELATPFLGKEKVDEYMKVRKIWKKKLASTNETPRWT